MRASMSKQKHINQNCPLLSEVKIYRISKHNTHTHTPTYINKYVRGRHIFFVGSDFLNTKSILTNIAFLNLF